jgi:hypothetical protein
MRAVSMSCETHVDCGVHGALQCDARFGPTIPRQDDLLLDRAVFFLGGGGGGGVSCVTRCTKT